MASYKVILKPSVEKDLRSLPQSIVQRAPSRVEALKDEPLPRGSIKLTGGEDLYRIRVGDYRLVYRVDTAAKEVLVHYVRHRRDVYRRL